MWLLLCSLFAMMATSTASGAINSVTGEAAIAESAAALNLITSNATTPAVANASAGDVEKASSDWAAKDYALVVGPALTALVASIAVWASMVNTGRTVEGARQNAEAQRWRDANQAELARLEALIGTFHVPYKVLSEANHIMARDLRARLGDPNFRMLTSLLDSDWRQKLSTGDAVLVEEICRNGRGLKAFIEAHGGSADDQLAEHLARAATHFRILWLAYKGALGNDSAPFERYVYPRALDYAIDADLARIKTRCVALRASPSVDHGLIPALVLPPKARLEPWPDPVRAPRSGK